MVYDNSGSLPPLQESEEKCTTNKQVPVLFTPLTTTLLYCCRWHGKVKEVGYICLLPPLSIWPAERTEPFLSLHTGTLNIVFFAHHRIIPAAQLHSVICSLFQRSSISRYAWWALPSARIGLKLTPYLLQR